MRHAIRLFIALFLVAIVILSCGCSKEIQSLATPHEIDIRFYHDTACSSCDGEEEFTKMFNEILADVKGEYPYRMRFYNVFTSEGMADFNKEAKKWGVSSENIDFPSMLINGKLYSGMQDIEQNLFEEFLSAGKDILAR